MKQDGMKKRKNMTRKVSLKRMYAWYRHPRNAEAVEFDSEACRGFLTCLHDTDSETENLGTNAYAYRRNLLSKKMSRAG